MSNSAGKSCQPARDKDGRRILVDRYSATGKTLRGAGRWLAFLPALAMLMVAVPMIQYSTYQARRAAYYEEVVQNLSEPIVVIDQDGVIVLSNIAAHQLFGCQELAGCLESKSVYDFVQSSDQQQTLMDMRTEDGKFPDQNISLVLKKHHDGSVFDADVGIRQLHDMNGQPSYVAVVLPRNPEEIKAIASAPILKVEKAPVPPSPEVAAGTTIGEGFTLKPNDAQRAAKEVYRRAAPTRSFIAPRQYQQWQQQQQQQQQWTP